MAGVYRFIHTLDPSGTNVIASQGVEENTIVVYVPDEMTVGEYYTVEYSGDGGDGSHVWKYEGKDYENGVYFTEGSTIYYVTRDYYDVNDEVPYYSDRSENNYVACFLEGTRIATPYGEVAVEDLAIGDLVITADGGVAPVKWLGRQTVFVIFDVGDRAPILIGAGALGQNLPVRDLKLTADHALLLDGMLVQAGALENGLTIRQMTRAETGDSYTVWHIETEGHRLILAEGCAAETFVDNVSRRRFDNYAEFVARFGEDADPVAELDFPRIKSARQLTPELQDLVAVRQAA